MFTLATVETAVFDRAYLLGIPAPKHLVHEAGAIPDFRSMYDKRGESELKAKQS
jgi:hypothetical protein